MYLDSFSRALRHEPNTGGSTEKNGACHPGDAPRANRFCKNVFWEDEVHDLSTNRKCLQKIGQRKTTSANERQEGFGESINVSCSERKSSMSIGKHRPW